LSGQDGNGPRAALVAIVAGALLAGAVVRSPPTPAASAANTASPGTAPVPVATAPGTTRRATTTTTRLLPAPPRPRPLPPVSPGLAPIYSRLPIPDKVVFLGIDDGLVRDPAVLDHLGGHRIPFVAFLTQNMAEAEPAFWRRAVAAGGTIQSHTVSHPDLTTLGLAGLRREVCGTIEPYTALSGGKRPALFRPPFGKVNSSVQRVAAECGYQGVILWKGSTNNGRLTMQEGALQPGDIILLHFRDTLRDDIDDVVARCRQEGFTIGRLEDYFPAS
jgi:peptidoglycan/xylan/chitin deacetylase (PgdA/CDA1 family)